MGCKTRVHRKTDGYEGETTRLSLVGAKAERRCGGWSAFPWWTLWMVWPLVMLVKWTAPLLGSIYAELMALSVPLLPVALILVGLALIVRRRME